ncbi:target of Myb protein 1 [Trichonephila inaurata madagascariensis]|uniref:Target of Myb protein 1 n=1 Tax=Trichonephila inaurata madagascariensis TaxID=2747483 RepID=A0A8X6YWZ5_9ARAC|nr:target of Myb protein 1 [Trichonephila inaurata madagascariensis]
MAGLLATLGGNPLNTPVGQKIEQATDGALQSENWALNMEICDMINDTDEGPKDAVKAIRKRLQQNTGKNYTVVLYTLTVLETCVKNCKRRFHLLVMQKDFILELVKLIGPKNDPPAAVQEKVLSLIQSWADAFQGNPEMQGVVQVYHDLKQKGIEFPMTDLDAMAPIHTPQRSVLPSSSPPSVVSDQTVHAAQPNLHQNPNPMPDVLPPQAVPINLNAEQLAKLRSELDTVQGNMKVFGEMLTELTPGKEHPQDLELLQELQKTCFAMQSRVVDLIDRIGVEEVTSDLLRINDELNNLFLRYDRYEKKRTAMTSPIEQKTPTPLSENPLDKPLIDFGESGEEADQAIAKVTNINLQDPSGSDLKPQNASKNSVADEFDMFAQSRNTSFGSSKNRGSSYEDNTNLDQIEGGLASFTANKGKPMEGGDSRASDAKPNSGDRLANIPSVAGATAQSNAISNRRQMDKDDADSALFAL